MELHLIHLCQQGVVQAVKQQFGLGTQRTIADLYYQAVFLQKPHFLMPSISFITPPFTKCRNRSGSHCQESQGL